MNRSSNHHHSSRDSYSSHSNGRSNGTPKPDSGSKSYSYNTTPRPPVAPVNLLDHSELNRLKQLAKLQEINNLPKPTFTNLKPFERKFYTESQITQSRAPQDLADFMEKNNISVAGNRAVRPILGFNELDIPKTVMNKIYDLDYRNPTPIQSMCWPALLSGQNMVGIAQTGSGKTLGFILPMLVHISNNQRYLKSFGREDTPGPVALVIAPTRELAQQIQQVAEDFLALIGCKNIVIYGGAPKQPQIQQIKRGADVYIATPGRLLDYIKDNVCSLGKVTYLVLDEADRMLDMGFEPQIRKVIEQIRPDRQTAMFSATWPKEVRKLAEDFITDYVHINIGAIELTANPNIRQIVEICQEADKETRLKDILAQIMNDRDSKAIAFAETKKRVDQFSQFMRNLGHYCLTIHGDKKQQEREWVLSEFKNKPKAILCATDVAARGLNISDIKYVINIDYPMQTEDYVHRIGRTARSSNSGTSFTFITNENARHVPSLIQILKEANQYIDESILNMARNQSQMNGFKNLQTRPNPRASNMNGLAKYIYKNNQNSTSQQAYPDQNASQVNFLGRKRGSTELNELQNNNINGDGIKRVKKNRWDDGDSKNEIPQNVYPIQSYPNTNPYMMPPQLSSTTIPSNIMPSVYGPPVPPPPTPSQALHPAAMYQQAYAYY